MYEEHKAVKRRLTSRSSRGAVTAGAGSKDQDPRQRRFQLTSSCQRAIPPRTIPASDSELYTLNLRPSTRKTTGLKAWS